MLIRTCAQRIPRFAVCCSTSGVHQFQLFQQHHGEGCGLREVGPAYQWYAVRHYHPDKPTPPGSKELPVHMVKPGAAPLHLNNSAAKHIDELPPVEEEAEERRAREETALSEELLPSEEQVKQTSSATESTAEAAAAVTEATAEAVATTTAAVREEAKPAPAKTVQLGWGRRTWNATKAMAIHYYDGTRLLMVEVRVSARLSKKIFRGESLTRRERNQLKRTVGDLFRLVPMAMFILIPFMELLLPVALYFFPGMMPSTFETIDKKKEKKLKKLKLKLDLAKFVQESMVSGITLQNGQPYQLERFSEFIARTRSQDPRDDIEELVSFSRLFSEDLTLDNLPSTYIVALCQLLNLDTGFHTDAFLRFRLRSRMRALKEDDTMIRSEGLHSMSGAELQQANVDRGMRSVGVSVERLTNQLDQWLILSLDKEVPMTLLLLSRVMTLTAGQSVSYEGLRVALGHLPDSLIGEAKISLAAQAGEKLDNKARLEAVRQQEEMIQAERAQQEEKELRDTETARKLEEVKAKEQSNTRVAANLQMSKETLKDMAKPILTEDQQEFRRQEIAEIQRVITSLRDKKNPLLEEKEELRDLIEKALVYHMTVEEGSVKASTGNMLLANKIAKMLNHSHKVLAELERSLTGVEQNLAETDDVVLTKGEVKSAIKEILDLDKKEKLLAILEVLSESHDKTIQTSEILKGLEKIAKEGTDLTGTEISAIKKFTTQRHKGTTTAPATEKDPEK